jgi:hypothetical protein
VVVVLRLLLILNGQVVLGVGLLPHLVNQQLVVAEQVVGVLAVQVVQMVLVVLPEVVVRQVEVTNQFLVIVHFTVGIVVVVEAVMLINIPQVVAEDRQQLVRPRVVTKLVMVVLALGDQVIHPI